MNNTVQQLAKDFGVSTTDLMCFANSIANSLKQDKVTAEQVEKFSEVEKADLIQAYACHANRKIQTFQTAYITNTNVKHAVRQAVFESFA